MSSVNDVVWETVANHFDPPVVETVDDPVAWAAGHGDQLWSKQREIIEALRDEPRVAVHSAHSMGKSFTAAEAACWWIDSHPVGQALVVTTAPTFKQVKAILWKEIKRLHKRGRLPGRTNLTEWHVGDEMVALGIKPADWDPEAFQGHHALYVLVIIDEAAGVPKVIWEAAESIASNDFARILAIGNPDNARSYFATVCDPSSTWHVIHVDGLKSPNFTDERVSPKVAQSLMSVAWADNKKQVWGEASPLYQSKVRGLFPTEDDEGVVPWKWLALCTVHNEDLETDIEPVELGVDCGAGGDLSVIQERRGAVAGRQWKLNTRDPEVLTQAIVRAQKDSDARSIKIDSIGIGWGIVGSAKKELRGIAHVHGINVASSPSDKKRFFTLRDELWWMARELSRTQAWDLSAIDDDTIAQVASPQYELRNGKVKVEPKAETKERLGHSPDEADALILAWANPVVYRPRGTGKIRRPKGNIPT